MSDRKDGLHTSMRLPGTIAEALQRAAEEEDRDRNGQILHYIRRGLKDDGRLQAGKPPGSDPE